MALLLTGGCYGGLTELDQNVVSGGGVEDGDGGEDAGEEPAQLCEVVETGPTKLRRLTRSQYQRTIRDLLGVSADVADGFAPDERVGAFKSNAVAPVGDLQVEQYMDAAELIAADAAADLSTLLPCDPAAIGEAACAEQWLRELAPRAYRRPLTDADIGRLMDVYSTARADEDFETGIRVALQGILQSPWFLYHVELGDPDVTAPEGEPVALTGHELASRLSYFLWDTMPDDALFDAADAGELDTIEGVEAQVDRMLADGKAADGIALFHTQWLGVDEIESLEKSATVFPDFDAGLAQAMKDDTASFANWVLQEGDGRLSTLLTGAFTLSEDPDLLALYGVELPPDHVSGEPIALPADQRAGLLTQPAVMARHAHADQTSPVHRGQMVRENVLCQLLPPPPPEVDNVPPNPDPDATTRERFEAHSEVDQCRECHVLIDGIGFGFENYDATGAFRTMEGDLPVDASGEIVGTDDSNGTFDGAVELAQILATSEEVRRCTSQQWFNFALGRVQGEEDSCSTEQIHQAFVDSDYDVRELILTIVTTDAFRLRKLSAE